MESRATAPDILNLAWAAEYLHISAITLYRLMNKQPRSLPGIKVGGQWRFLKTQLDDYLRGIWVPPHQVADGQTISRNGNTRTRGRHAHSPRT